MDDRLRFVAGLLDGEPMSVLCYEFGVSRKTGYKTFSRYRTCGPCPDWASEVASPIPRSVTAIWRWPGFERERFNPGALLRPGLDPLRGDARFTDPLRRVGLDWR